MTQILVSVIAAVVVVILEWLNHKADSKRAGSRWAARALPLAVILALGVWLRADAVHVRLVYAPGLGGDEIGYSQLAIDLLAGKGFTWPGRTPLLPFWLAGMYALFGNSVKAALYAQVLPGAISILLAYAIGKELFGRWAGLATAFLTAANFLLLRETASLYSEAFYLPFLLAAVLALTRAFHAPALKRFAWAGAWIGLCSLVRPTTFLLPVFLLVPLLILFRRAAWRSWAAMMAASAIVMAPWMVYTTARYHAWIPLATSNAFLWQGSPEYYHLIHDQGYTYLDVWRKVIYGPDGQAHDPGSVEGDRWWTQRALRSIAAEPLVYLRYDLEKAVTFWAGDSAADWANGPLFHYQTLRSMGLTRSQSAQVMLLRFLPLLLPVLVVLLRRQWRGLLPVYAVLVYFNLLHALMHAEARLSEPLQPLALAVWVGAAMEVLPFLMKRVAKRAAVVQAEKGNPL